jgi:hypothetical protein
MGDRVASPASAAGVLLIRSYAATATMTSVPQVPVASASALVRAKHRGHVACPQASLSNRSTAPRLGRNGCATRPPSRQEQGTGRHAPTRPRHCYYRDLPYCPRRADQRLRGPVLSCRAPSAALLAPVRVCRHVTTVFSESRCADDARETVNEWCNDAWSRYNGGSPSAGQHLHGRRLFLARCCFRGLLPSGPGSDPSLGLRLMLIRHARRSAVVLGWREREIELGET